MSWIGHITALGPSGSGKGHHANLLHRSWPGVSIYFNSKPTADVAGTVCRHPTRLGPCILEDAGNSGRALVNYKPMSSHEEDQIHDLEEVADRVRRWAQNAASSTADQPGYQVIVDEADKFDGEGRDPVRLLAKEGREDGVRLVGQYQYWSSVGTVTRDQMGAIAVHGYGPVSFKTLSNDSFFPDEILPWINEGYQFALWRSGVGWTLHEALPPAGSGRAVHRL